MLTIGPVTINIAPILNAANDPLAAAWFLVASGGWLILLVLFIWLAKQLWYNHISDRYVGENLKPLLLAIDVPKRSVQTPKGVENIFAHLAGAHGSANRRETHLQGKVQEWFSLEMISIDGYVQFLVWTWDKYRDLVETAIYAQYADAQITEVEDYAKAVPHQYPDAEWDLWGTEFVYTADQGYPVRTWPAFEHAGQKDEPFKDPLAAMMENMSRLVPGEQIWFQILIRPISQEWQKKSMKLVKKLIGAKAKPHKSLVSATVEAVGSNVVAPVIAQVLGTEFGVAVEKRPEPESKILYLSPGERAAVEAIEEKAAKIGFDVKIRVIYAGKKEVFVKQHGAHAVIGAIKQYNTNDLNSLKPDFKNVGPSSLWLFKKQRNNWRKTKLVRAYALRSMWVGRSSYVMNIEELASLWHFPTPAVHAPLIASIAAKRAAPPTGLPVERTIVARATKSSAPPPPAPSPAEEQSGAAPGNLPVA